MLITPFFFALALSITAVVNANSRADLWYKVGYDYSQQASNNEAFYWMMRAAKAGHMAAQNNIGLSYLHGLGVEQDDKKAFEWFAKAAKQGLAYAQSELAMLYYQQGNTIKAQRWWQMAADVNDEYAQFNLASLFLEQKNIKQAYYWFWRANENKHPEAQAALSALKEK